MKKKVVILCGGRGSRLGSLTEDIPKPLVKIKDYSILEYKLKFYSKSGFNEYIFCTGYKGQKIEKKIIDLGYNGIFSNIGINAGILERLFSVRNHLTDSTIISYGDTYAEIDFNDLILKHKKSQALITLVITSINHPFGLINFNESNEIISFNEKPLLNHYIGYAVFEPSIFNLIPKSLIKLPDGNGIVEIINYFISKRQVNTYNYGGLQISINTKEELKVAKDKISYYTLNE